MSDAQPAILELQGITKKFPGVVALDDVSLHILPGEVHAVLGENGAGKSTLMNILAGELQPNSGKILYKGQETAIPNASVSQQLGISVVYQELALCNNLSVAENISLRTVSGRFALSFVNRKSFRQEAAKVLERLGMSNLNVNLSVGSLPVAQQQMVEIAKAIALDAKVLILDEPNSALTNEETAHLFRVIRQLRKDGVSIIYVSHRLEEVLQISDRITVLRDGRWIDTFPNSRNVTVTDIIAKMVGRAVDQFFERDVPQTVKTEVALSLDKLGDGKQVHDVSLELFKGEVLGIAGLPDSGKDELVSCMFGLQSYKGDIYIAGKHVNVTSPGVAIRHGAALIPADRRSAGAILVMSVQDNTVAANLKQVSMGGFLNAPAIRKLASYYANRFDTKISSLKQRMATLSGGNQQKVILSRGLATHPDVLVLHEPTRGIDVGAKAEIYAILQELATEGVAILVVSSELPELISQCDRILVMCQGRLNGEFAREDATEEAILAASMGHHAQEASYTGE